MLLLNAYVICVLQVSGGALSGSESSEIRVANTVFKHTSAKMVPCRTHTPWHMCVACGLAVSM